MMTIINYIYKSMKSVVVSFIMLYTLNILIYNINVFVPINFFTIIVSTILGMPGIIYLTYISFFIN